MIIDSCMFYNDLAVYEGFGGIVLAKEEGENISRALGKKNNLILQNHGLVCPTTPWTHLLVTFLSLVIWFRGLWEKTLQFAIIP